MRRVAHGERRQAMPAPRKRAPKTEDAKKTNTPDTEVEDEAEGDEAEAPKARAPRTPKVYTVKNAELANELAGDDFDEIAEGDPATGEMIEAMRNNKAKWDSPEDGGIKHVFDSNTAIPFRNMLNRFLAE